MKLNLDILAAKGIVFMSNIFVNLNMILVASMSCCPIQIYE